MATPVFEDLPKDVFTKIATGITQGQVHLVNNSPNNIVSTYIQPTGDPKPADNVALGVPVFQEKTSEDMSFTVAADVYLMPVSVASRVRVDV